MNRIKFFGFGAALTILLSSCSINLTTNFEVKSATEASVSTSVVFKEDAAKALLDDKTLLDGVEDYIEKETGATVEVEKTDTEVSYSAALDYDKLSSISSVAGVSAATLTAVGEEAVKLEVSLVTPERLIVAITEANAGEEDSEALIDTIKETTSVEVRVSFPGDVISSEAEGAVIDGKTFSYSKNLKEITSENISVTGSTEKDFFGSIPVTFFYAAGALLIFGALAYVAYRRRN